MTWWDTPEITVCVQLFGAKTQFTGGAEQEGRQGERPSEQGWDGPFRQARLRSYEILPLIRCFSARISQHGGKRQPRRVGNKQLVPARLPTARLALPLKPQQLHV